MELDNSSSSAMKTSTYSILPVLLFALLVMTEARADLRVLIKFDAMEHRIHRLVSVESDNPAFATEQSLQNSVAQNPGKVSVMWIGADGSTLLSSSMDDPRLVHTPLTNSDSGPTIVSLNEGAYMVSGPSNSQILEIRLPANSALALDAQVWQFELTP